ncbi:hypothetical protein M404DRAFT_840399 [Pisolithus tinctorius Marx 270]|uniref:Uncharacterized protein n=1 Tax=Pisolithus tinctorius Marx 270 TaxID=870435 RepID=A0A0C3PRS1_PISTI|nr:hypothetical protein M404DRAFT_840399 [Pisolithus tinctorius Marx 270]
MKSTRQMAFRYHRNLVFPNITQTMMFFESARGCCRSRASFVFTCLSWPPHMAMYSCHKAKPESKAYMDSQGISRRSYRSWFPCFQDSGVYAAVLRANVFPADLLSGTSSWFPLNAHTVTPTPEIMVL